MSETKTSQSRTHLTVCPGPDVSPRKFAGTGRETVERGVERRELKNVTERLNKKSNRYQSKGVEKESKTKGQ